MTIENTGTNTFSGGTTIMAGTLNLNAVQGLGTGTVTLNGGELVLNTAGTTEGTLGLVATNKLIFAGGIFTYGTGATQDISGLIDAAASTRAIQVNTNGNNIAWATYTQELGNKDIVKLGDGLLTVNTTLGGAFTGAITVSGGTLFYDIGANGATRTWSGNISIAQDATLQIRDNRAHASTMTDTLSGRISGAGSLVLGHKEEEDSPEEAVIPSAETTAVLRARSSWWATAPTPRGMKWPLRMRPPLAAPAWSWTDAAFCQ